MSAQLKSRRNGQRRSQTGITTLAITLILLVIVSMMAIFSTSVGFFEQKTTTNENRARISQQAAEYAINLAGEYLKANRTKLISNKTSEGGWLAPAPSTTARWFSCAAATPYSANHPCLSEPDPTRRAQLYFWTADGTKGGSQLLPYDTVTAAAPFGTGLGGAAATDVTSSVRALLCRLDTSVPTNVHCALTPVAGNRVALTLISDATLNNENGAKGAVKETWASYSTFVPSATVPLVASGFVTGLGNGEIVASADSQGNGSNLMASIWSPNNVERGGSYITCQFSEFTGQLLGNEMTVRDVKSTCPGQYGNPNPPCNCPKAPDVNQTQKEDFSGHTTGPGNAFHTGNDILDVAKSEPICDSTVNVIFPNCRTLPSITFFPGRANYTGPGTGTAMDDPAVQNDDSIFEYIFGVDYEAANPSTGQTLTNCGPVLKQNCMDYAMREEFNAQVFPDCSGLGGSSSGIIYIDGPCTSAIGGTIGSIDSPVIIVINQGKAAFSLGNGLILYGMLFIHSDTTEADVSGQNSQIYGSLVVEGSIKMTGKNLIVYDDTSASSCTTCFPAAAKFGRVPGSWLDAKTSF